MKILENVFYRVKGGGTRATSRRGDGRRRHKLEERRQGGRGDGEMATAAFKGNGGRELLMMGTTAGRLKFHSFYFHTRCVSSLPDEH